MNGGGKSAGSDRPARDTLRRWILAGATILLAILHWLPLPHGEIISLRHYILALLMANMILLGWLLNLFVKGLAPLTPVPGRGGGRRWMVAALVAYAASLLVGFNPFFRGLDAYLAMIRAAGG